MTKTNTSALTAFLFSLFILLASAALPPGQACAAGAPLLAQAADEPSGEPGEDDEVPETAGDDDADGDDDDDGSDSDIAVDEDDETNNSDEEEPSGDEGAAS